MRTWVSMIGLTAGLLWASCAHVTAATYWVGKSGSDSRACAQAQEPSSAKQTISSGAACLSSGDTLMISAGRYEEQLVNVIPSGGGEGNRTIVRAAQGATVTIAPPRRPADAGPIRIGPNRSYITLQDVDIDGSAGFGWVLQLNAEDADTHHIRLLNVRVRDNPSGAGMMIRPASYTNALYHELINVELSNNGKGCPELSLCHGAYVSGRFNVLDGLSVHDNAGHGMQFYSGGSGSSDNVIKHSKFMNNGTQGLGIYAGGNNNLLTNNTFSGNGGSGLRILGTGNQVCHSTFTRNRNEDINCEGAKDLMTQDNQFSGSPTQVSGCSPTASTSSTCGEAGATPPTRPKLPPPKHFRKGRR
jgi:hypothetical protein